MSRIDRLIRAAIDRAYATAKTGDSALELAKREVALALQRAPFDLTKDLTSSINSMLRDALRARDKAAGEEFGRQAGATSPEIQQLAQTARKVASERMAKVKLKTSDDAMRIVTDVLDRAPRGMNARRITALALKKLGIARHHAQAEADAARSAIDNIGRHDAARVAGITTFRYSGPTVNLRSFCAQHVGLVYTSDEIARMDNGQGLPVVHYCGGYYCRHRWTPYRYDPEPQRAKVAAELEDLMYADGPDGMPNDVPARRIVDSFDPRLPGTRLAKPFYNNIAGDEDEDGRTTFGFTLVDDDGNDVGSISRTFRFRDGRPEVYHGFMKWDQAIQGRGSATRIMEQSLKLYDEIGVEVVRVHSALDGGHIVWAKMGFNFDEEVGDQRRLWAHSFNQWLTSNGVGFDVRQEVVDRCRQPQDFINCRVTTPDGKVLEGAEWKRRYYKDSWRGVIDLTSQRSRARIDEYTETKTRRQK